MYIKKLQNYVWLARFAIGLTAVFVGSLANAAICEYTVDDSWGSGFVASIKITNDGSSAISAWEVSWKYTDGSTRTGGWNASVTGANPYTAKSEPWNSEIAPGASVSFGIQGNNGGTSPQVPTLTGAICGDAGPSSSSTSTSSSSSSSSGGDTADLLYSSEGVSITHQSVNWSTGLINISSATSVNISMLASGTGAMEASDYLNIYYRLNGGARIALSLNTNAFVEKSVSVENLSGSTLEIIVEGATSYSDETYKVSEIRVTGSGFTLEKYLKDGVLNHLGYRNGSSGSGSSSSSASSSAASSSGAGGTSSSGGGSSSSGGASPVPEDDITNTQEDGVDEADIIESDGTHLFVVREFNTGYGSSSSGSATSSSSTSSGGSTSSSSGGLTGAGMTITSYLPDAVNGSVTKLAEQALQFEEDILKVSGSYLLKSETGNRLAMVGETSMRNAYGWNYYPGYYAYYQVSNAVSIVITDVDDPLAVAEVERLKFDGELVSSRRIDNQLYVASRYSPNLNRLGFNVTNTYDSNNITRLNEAGLEDLLPHIYDSEGGSKPMVSAEDCNSPEWPEKVDAYAGSLVVLTKIDLDNTRDIQSVCLPASATDIYGSHDAIYTFGYGYNRGMKIHKFSIDETLDYRGSLKIEGYVPCAERPYCFGEQNGVLRVLYTEYSTSTSSSSSGSSSSSSSGSGSSASSSSSGGVINAVTPYRLALIAESADVKALEVVSMLPNASRPESIGKAGERVYGMRSFGDHAYVVTFDKVDPLYAIDLSDPTDPFIAGALEVSGFSQYLHPVGENLLIGIGKDAVYDVSRNITWYQGVKVELFDISDPTTLRSLGSEIIGKRGSETTVNSDPRAFAFRDDEYGMRFSLPIRVHNRLPYNGNPNALNQSYIWSHTGLYVFGIEDNAQGDAELLRKGVLKGSSQQIYFDRGVLDEGSVFYLNNYDMHSTLLENLEPE